MTSCACGGVSSHNSEKRGRKDKNLSLIDDDMSPFDTAKNHFIIQEITSFEVLWDMMDHDDDDDDNEQEEEADDDSILSSMPDAQQQQQLNSHSTTTTTKTTKTTSSRKSRSMSAMEATPVDLVAKILVLGDTSVGKSSLLCRYVHKEFDTIHFATIGVDFKCVNVRINDKYIVRCQFWDTAGQERFHSITSSYFRGSDACVLVYDITNWDSFENVKRWNSHLIEKTMTQLPRLLVGNKIDLESQRRVSDKEVQRMVHTLSDQEMGTIDHIPVSALTGQNINELFEMIIKKAVLSLRRREEQ